MDKAEVRGHISSFPFAKGSLLVNNLFFADDYLFFVSLMYWNAARYLEFSINMSKH